MHLLLLCIICFNFAPQANAECGRTGYGRVCTLQAVESEPVEVEIINDQLFVGTTNSLQVFNLTSDLQHVESVALSSGSFTVEQCSGFEQGQLGEDIEDCKNFIRTIQRVPNENQQVMVCGTNAHFPQCNIHQIKHPSNFRKLSAPDLTDPGYSPSSRTHPIEAIWASNGNFFAATLFNDGSRAVIRMSTGALQNDTSFTVGTPQNDRWLNTPNFVSVHEYGDHIFFFMSEPALELDGIQEVKYSRAVRICKTDTGISDTDTDPRNNNFLTFQKARIVCKVDIPGSIPFFYDEIASTFLGEGKDVLYGVFNSPENGPPGGAICKFSFGVINGVFEDRDYLIRVNQDSGAVWVNDNRATAFSCPGSESGQQRPLNEVATYQLKSDSITPTANLPLFVSTEFLDKVTAETVTFMGDEQEIIYYTNEHGNIAQVILSGSEKYSHTIYEADTTNPVEDLILYHVGHERSIVASSSRQIIQIPRGKCSDYTDCFSCFDSKDAYCGWDPNSQNCLNKFDNDIAALIQAFSATEARISTTCGSRPTSGVTPEEPALPCTQNPSTDPSTVDSEITSETEQEITEEDRDCTTGMTVPAGPLDTEGLSDEDSIIGIPVVIGASIGAFLFGLSLGSVVCIIFCKHSAGKKSDKKGSSPEMPKDNTAPPANETTVVVMQVNNNQQIVEKENLEMVNETKLKPVPFPRYIQHKPRPNKQPAPDPPTVVKSMPANGTHGSTISLPPMYAKHSNGAINRHHLTELSVEEDDSAFGDQDTLPPLRTFPSTGNMYGSLGRNKTATANGLARKHKAERVRTDSTTKLIKQRSESWSSDISSSTSPLQSPISDV